MKKLSILAACFVLFCSVAQARPVIQPSQGGGILDATGAIDNTLHTVTPTGFVNGNPAILGTDTLSNWIANIYNYVFFNGVDTVSGTTYAIVKEDNGRTKRFTNSGAVSVSLPAATATGFNKLGWSVKLENASDTGVVTVTPDTSTVDGDTTLVIGPRLFAAVNSDTTNYLTTDSTASQLTKINQQSTAAQEVAVTGSELLSASGWTTTGWTGTYAGGWVHTPGNTTSMTNTLAAVAGNLYSIGYTITNRTAGTVVITLGAQSNGSSAVSATGSFPIKATTTGTLSVAPTTDFDGTLVVSIKQITPIAIPNYAILDSTGTSSVEIYPSTFAQGNLFYGKGSGAYNISGTGNVGFGTQSLASIVSGTNNVAFGYQALNSVVNGASNTGIGYQAGKAITLGYNNTAIGYQALSLITSAAHHTAVGYGALAAATGGSANDSCVGESCLGAVNSGAANSSLGRDSGKKITTGSNNTVLGYAVGSTTLTTGSGNILIGTSSLIDTTASGDSNVFKLGNNAAPVISATAINTATPPVSVSGTLTVGTGGSTNHAVCWKTGGTLGYCSAVVDISGVCGTCN